MQVLIAIALKSVLIAGVTLGLLAVMKQRSAAERSWVAHIGLFALLLLALAPLVLPSWRVETPDFFSSATASAPVETNAPAPASADSAAPTAASAAPAAQAQPTITATGIAVATYALPAAILLLVTFLALARLIALRARADVLVDGHWLSALARAQRRMGFKHGTALLTSDDLSSPISWGLMRPVILLNSRAVEAAGEAEAIIAHELAHVARMDWIKLLLARVATALFWFNPLVWALAREAHQLREETADDAVLASDIADTDYAQLLVGVARHECPGLLLGAHGVAPSKSSLARRVARVLDGASMRGPVARPFAWGVLVGAMVIAMPLAALTLTPAGSGVSDLESGSATLARAASGDPYYTGRAEALPNDLPQLIASGVSTAVAAVAPQTTEPGARGEILVQAQPGRSVSITPGGIAVVQGGKAVVLAHPANRSGELSQRDVDELIQMKTIGVTSDYVQAMRAAVPSLRNADPSEFTGMRAVGVTPEFARGLVGAGFRNIDAEELTEARAIGLNGNYARAMASAGVPLDIDDYVALRATGVPASYVQELRKSGVVVRDPDKLVQLWSVGVRPPDVKGLPPGGRGGIPRTPPPPLPPHGPDGDDGS